MNTQHAHKEKMCFSIRKEILIKYILEGMILKTEAVTGGPPIIHPSIKKQKTKWRAAVCPLSFLSVAFRALCW